MFWLAANPSTPVDLRFRQEVRQSRLAARDQKNWNSMALSIATLTEGDRALGPVVLVEEQGFFVAHQGAVTGNTVTAKSRDVTFQLEVVSRERNSELVLLRAPSGFPETMKVFRKPQGDMPSGTLFAVLPTGPIRASISSNKRFGVIGTTRRGVPMSEVRFEAPSSQFGTGLLLSDTMELFGTLSGSLASSPTNANLAKSFSSGLVDQAGNIGPSAMMVAYSVGPDFVRRVLDGFISPSHQVVFPSLGVFCIDAVGGGALIQGVKKSSPAEAAGIAPGDILIDIGGMSITNQVDFARAMLKLEVGKKVVVRLRRGTNQQFREVLIGESGE